MVRADIEKGHKFGHTGHKIGHNDLALLSSYRAKGFAVVRKELTAWRCSAPLARGADNYR